MDGWPLVQVVDSLDQARVLFDFNPGRRAGRWLGQDDFDYGSPEWDSSVLGLTEGSRTISLGFLAQGRAATPAIARLSEVLTRTTPGYLMWQLRPDSQPLWFRLQRQPSANPLDFTTVWADQADRSMWRWKVDLVTDAFALGAKQTLAATTAFAGAGTAGTSLLSPVEITDPILGDAPAPLNLDLNAGNLAGYRAQLLAWATDPAATTTSWIARTPNEVLSAPGPQLIDVADGVSLPPGQYRTMACIQRSTNHAYPSRWSGGVAGLTQLASVLSAPATVTPPAGWMDTRWVDCGRVNLPPGMDYVDMPEDALPAVDWQVQFDADSESTANQWRLEQVLVVPVQAVTSRAATSVLSATFGAFPASGGLMRVDGERSRVGAADATSGKWAMASPAVVDGAFPRVHPGARNFVLLLPRTNDVAAQPYGTPGSTTMWYYPRHLHVGAR